MNEDPQARGRLPLPCLFRRRGSPAAAPLPADWPGERLELDVDAADAGTAAIAALRAAVAARPGRDLLLVDATLGLPAHAWSRLQMACAAHPETEVWTALADDVADLDPRPEQPRTAGDVDAAVWSLSPRLLPETDRWSARLSLWRADAAARAAGDPSLRVGRLPATLSGRCCDLLYVGAGGARSADGDPPPSVAALRGRLAEPRRQPLPHHGLDGRPVLLHLLHGWGGGAERFVRDLVAGDTRFNHLVLRPAGDPGRRRHGERLELLADLDEAPLRRYPLSAPILATTLGSDEYRQLFADLCAEFAVGALLVSSLIGHSLDALRSPLPTVLVAHDYYPLWPVLHADFGAADADFSATAIAAALAAERDSPFAERDPGYWQALRAGWLAAVTGRRLPIVTPTDGVRSNLLRIEPALADLPFQRIEHGLADWPQPATAGPAPAGTPLRIVVPGRIAGGKGEVLLAALLPTLPDGIELILLGAGAAGMRFFGCRGVHVLLDYDRDTLPQQLAELRPAAALLPSTVAETYSYMLSELRSLGLPVIASRLGSFAERIRDGVDGLLVAPEADAVRALLLRLRDQRALLTALEPGPRPPSLADMAAQYAGLITPRDASPALPTTTPAWRAAADAEARASALATRAETRRAELATLQQELERRADWALGQQRLAEERLAWAKRLQQEVTEVRAHGEALDAELERRTAWAHSLQREIDAMQAQAQELMRQRDEFERQRNRILASSSWRLTAPLRVSRRATAALLARLRFRAAQAMNLQRRTRASLKRRGLTGTLARIRRELRPPLPQTTLTLPAERPALSIDGIAFARVDAPRASIIVPAYNHIEHSLTCLRALAEQAQQASFEVILVDDCSRDETPTLLPQIPGLVFIRNERNLGFIGACNAGAAAARGDFVVFLNNDTAVQPDWLDALLDTFAQVPEAGLVGARLVYPDGRLQEAGGIVFSDGSGWNYGRFDDPADPRYNYVRDVDYCSGAAIALPTPLFRRLGGFDAHYAPAYYEDTDLAMRVRAEGLRVLYQPASVVVHFEGVTSGTDTASGVKAYQVSNQQKFLDRWRDVLATHPAPGTDIALAREHRARCRVLIIDATTPTPDQDSGSVRLVNIMRILRADGCAVTFFADNRAFVDGYTQPLQQLGVEVLWHPYLADPVRWFAEHGRHFDLVLVSRHYIASNYLGLIRMHAPRARFVFDTVDLHYLREQRAAELSGSAELARTAADTRARELALIREADITLVVSPVEQALLAREAPGRRVDVLSNVHEVVGCRRGFAERTDLMFVGGFQHPPNIDAARWFAQGILPRVRAELPEVRFHIVGSRAPADVTTLGELDGVVFHGFVEDLAPLLDGIRIAVAPLRYGAGVKGKVNMSMAWGQPVVATTMASEGMYLEPGRDVLVADDAASFAAEVVRLYRDQALWQRLSDNGLANVERHFGFDAARQAVRRLFD